MGGEAGKTENSKGSLAEARKTSRPVHSFTPHPDIKESPRRLASQYTGLGHSHPTQSKSGRLVRAQSDPEMVQHLQCSEGRISSVGKEGHVTITEGENLESDPKEDRGVLIIPVSSHSRSNRKTGRKQPIITLQLHPSSFPWE